MAYPKTTVALVKHHGLGNDFLIALAPEIELGADHARDWCNRHTGFGADGLLVAHPAAGNASLDNWSMVLWNADGSRAEISGNGLRCLGQAISMYRMSNGNPSTDVELVVSTDVGPRTLSMKATEDNTWSVKTSMGSGRQGPTLATGWQSLDLEPLGQVAVDLGNPHLVGFFPGLEAIEISKVGPEIEREFAEGMNVHCVRVTGPGSMDLVVWERGVGVTQACGSGACAAAWAAHTLGLAGAEITVTMPGGSATVELAGDDIHLTGPSTYIGQVLVG